MTDKTKIVKHICEAFVVLIIVGGLVTCHYNKMKYGSNTEKPIISVQYKDIETVPVKD